jgi:hypothetical protein
MFKPHPNLSDEVNNAIIESELSGGAYIEKLAVGKKLLVQTRNTLYTIERREDGLYISGSARFCPEPRKCVISGSTFGGSMLRMGYIGVGMYMEFMLDIPESERKIGYVDGHGRIVTSEIQDVREA